MNIGALVTDSTHVDTAYVEIRVSDANDNAPLFVPNSKKVRHVPFIYVG